MRDASLSKPGHPVSPRPEARVDTHNPTGGLIPCAQRSQAVKVTYLWPMNEHAGNVHLCLWKQGSSKLKECSLEITISSDTYKAHSNHFFFYRGISPEGEDNWCLVVCLPPSSEPWPFQSPGTSKICLSFKLGASPTSLKTGQIYLLLIRLALSVQRATGVISVDKRTRKEWMLCLSANLIQPLSTTKSSRQRRSPGKFTQRFSSHCWLE